MNPLRLAKSIGAIAILVASLFVAGSAFAAGPQAAATGSANSIALNKATLNGSVNPNGLSTSWYFEYGTTAAYGSKTTPQAVGPGGSKAVSATISNLTPGSGYHYRLVASNSSGTSLGADVGFSTSGTAPTVKTVAASSIATTSAKLTGTVNPNGLATSWYFVYGSSSSYGLRTASQNAGSGKSSINVSASLSGLNVNSVYHFQLVASNAAGTTGGGDLALSTLGPPTAQATPAVSLTPTTATLTGTLAPNGVATSWHFDYGTTSSYGSSTPAQTLAATSPATPVSAAVSGLTPGIGYHFRLVASSSAGTSASGDLSLATPSAVTLNEAVKHVVSGHYAELSGSAWGGQAGVSVTILAQPFGGAAAAPVASVLTGAGGLWTYPARPSILTTYSASAEGGTSGSVLVAVAPAATLRLISGERYLTQIGGPVSFAGHVVQLQRLTGTTWKTIERERLNASSSATFLRGHLPAGRGKIRIALSVNQAGPGYLAGFSRELSYNRPAAKH